MDDSQIDRLREAVAVDPDAFADRVHEEASVLKRRLRDGTFDDGTVTLGLEHEFYAVDRDDHGLRRIPRSLFRTLGFGSELGVHNAELNVTPQPCNGPGLDAQTKEVESRLSAFQRRAAGKGLHLVSDGVWTLGPAGHSTAKYLTGATREDGLVLGINVTDDVRLHGFSSTDRPSTARLDVPGATLEADTHAPASLTASIQPHYGFARAADLPDGFRYALRVAGPLLAVGVDSPFLPPELYDDPEPDRDVLFRQGWAETRVPIYESLLNPPGVEPKVRFPRDLDSPSQGIERIVEDRLIVPAAIDGTAGSDEFPHFWHKFGSYWRWIRPVFGGHEEVANVRVEFRPLPAQPTIPDGMAFLATFGGLLTALREREHPVADLAWDRARENFYAAARDGLDADMVWITADGKRTTDQGILYDDLFGVAADGLERHGLSPDRATAWVEPLRDRVRRERTPADWKRAVVADHLDGGASVQEAIRGMQHRYIDLQTGTLLSGGFADWPDP